MSDRRPFAPLSLAELFTLNLPEPDWIVPGLLPAGSATLFAGREKSGKSLALVDLCCSLAFEEPFLDREVKPGAVLYMPAEDALPLVRHRISQRVDDRRDGALFVQSITGETGVRFCLDAIDAVEAFQDLDRLIKAHDIRLVALDPLRELHDGQEDRSDDMAPICRPLRQLAHETGAAVIVAHHMSRAGSARGSTAIPASFDQVWSFARTEGDDAKPAGTLTVEGRYGPKVSLRIALGDGLRWQLADPTFAGPTGNARERIVAHLLAVGAGRTSEQIAADLGEPSLSLKTIQNELSRLLKERPSPIVSRGAGHKNDPREYRHTEAHLWPDGEPENDSPQAIPIGNGFGGNHRAPMDTIAPVVPDPSGKNGNEADALETVLAGSEDWEEF